MTVSLRAWKTGRVRTRAARLAGLILHPRAGALLPVALALLAFTGGLLAQSRGRKPERRGPRALAVLEVAANGRMELIPVTILDSGKFYDAGLYRAVPRPMALEDGVVYEGTHAGESLGLFTVNGAQKVNGAWIGLGRWRASTASEPVKTSTGQRASNAPTDNSGGSSQKQSGRGDDGPVLRRPPRPQSRSTSDEGRSSDSSSREPTASKPAASTPQETEPADRPTLRRRKSSRPDEEPEIPPLTPRGGTPAGAPQPEPAPSSRATVSVLPPGTKFLAAVSDAEGPDARSFAYNMDPAERQRFTGQLSAMAYAAVTRFASSRPGQKPAAASALSATEVRVFDVHLNNEPVLVFSARLPELPSSSRGGLRKSSDALQYWVTVVARVDMYHELRQLFAQVTDSSHLDVYPRLELIDAVDADGNGTGELLFRENYERGYSFILYRVGMDKLWELFDGAKSGS